MQAKTITSLVNKAVAQNEDAGKLIADLTQQEKDIKLAIRQRTIKIYDLKEAYNANVSKLNDEIKAVQKTCPHIETTFFGDPSGNNDSYTKCDWCQREF